MLHRLPHVMSLVARRPPCHLPTSSITSTSSLCTTPLRHVSTSSPVTLNLSNTTLKASTMSQVEVDEAEVQRRLGKVNMDFIKKAEKRNKERSRLHRFFRRKDWLIASICFTMVGTIYGYTIWAIQQEKFLDDFDMPEE